MKSGIDEYRSIKVNNDILNADPHQITQLLMQGALDRIASARVAMERKDHAHKGIQLTKAMDIVNELRTSLDKDAGGELAEQLEQLYNFMERNLINANMNNDARALDEVTEVLQSIKSGWDQIPEEEKQKYASQSQINS